jgi:hypothetical protein
MSDAKLLSLACDLRACAEEISTRAETFYDPNARQKMRGVALRCEKLAERAEEHAHDSDKARD